LSAARVLVCCSKHMDWTCDYNATCKTVGALNVLNDCAERAVRLATDFNKVLTKSDEQRQLLYQVVEHHQKLLPTGATEVQLIQAHTKWHCSYKTLALWLSYVETKCFIKLFSQE
jgi:hypothetical protein